MQSPNDIVGVAEFDLNEQEDVEAYESDEDIQFGTYQRMCRFGGGDVMKQIITRDDLYDFKQNFEREKNQPKQMCC